LNPEDSLKRKAVNRLSLIGPESMDVEKRGPAKEEGPQPAAKQKAKA
jgi:hypothetical protein